MMVYFLLKKLGEKYFISLSHKGENLLVNALFLEAPSSNNQNLKRKNLLRNAYFYDKLDLEKRP